MRSTYANFPEQLLKIVYLEEAWQVFHGRFLFERCFWGFVLPELEFCFEVWCTAAGTHHKLFYGVVNGERFYRGVFD